MAVENKLNYNIHMVSDSTGETLSTIAKAVLVQYKNLTFQQHMHSLVRSKKQIDLVFDSIKKDPGVVLYTLNNVELRKNLWSNVKELNKEGILNELIFSGPKTLAAKD